MKTPELRPFTPPALAAQTPEAANLRRPRRLGLPAVLLLCLSCLRFPFWASAQADTSIYEPYSITTLAGLALNSGSTDNTGSLARFNRPYGVAVDGFSTVYVADTGNHSIRKITSGGAVTLLAGIPGTSGSANGANLGSMFSNPTGVAVDSTGNVYVADYNNHLIRQISGGTVSTLAGSVGVAGSTDGTGTAAQFRNPFGVAVNSAGTVVYVSDMNNQTIRMITVPGGVVTTLTGSPNVNGSTDGPNNVALFNTPRGIAVDSGGNIFVSDSGNLTVRKILSGGGVSTLAGAVFTPGFNDGPGLGARFSILQAISPFGGPCGVAVDASGNVYVADQGSTGAGYTIRKITPGLSVTTLAGSVGVAGSTDATGIAVGFNLPAGVAVDSAGKIYVADTVNHTIRVGVDTNCGNSVPVITCPTNKMVNCGTAWTFDAPIATSACGTNLTVSVLHTVTNTGPCSTVITRTWQATSCFGAGMKSWSPLGAGLNGEVFALTEMGGNLYVGGQFTTAGGASANHIAKWNGTSWSQLGSGITNGLNGGVYALAVMGGKLFAAGYFTTAGGVTATNIAQWDGTSWSALGTGLVAYSAVEALAVIGTDLYVGGGFSTADGGPGNLIAKYNTLTSVWSPLGSGMNDRVNSLTVVGTDLYAGGQFTSAGGVSANFVAKWNGSNWSALGTGMDFRVGGSLGVLGGNLYAGGVFTSAGGNSANRVAKWDIANSIWSSVGTGINNGMNDEVEGFAVMGTDLYASGGFMTAGGVSANRVAQWNGSTWSALGTGMNNGVWRLAVIGQDLYAGGIFTTAGGLSANYIAKWGADCIPITVTCSQTVTIVDTTPPVFTCTNPSVIAFSAGTTSDNFVGPEPASPSAGLILRLQSNGISSLKGFDDNCAINTFFAHTFTNLPLCITKATLSVRLKGCSSSQTYNDTFGLSFTSPSGALAQPGWSRYLGSHNSNPATGLFTDFDSGTTLDVVLDLSLLPNADGSTTDLIPTLNVQGFLDLVIQDDSAIDFAVLTVTSCCATETKTVECGTTWTFDAPTVSDSCSGTNVTLTVLSTVTNGVCPRIITRTWKATDACGNSVTNSQAVTVVDTTPPLVVCATNKTVNCGTAWTFDAPTVSDSCNGTNVTLTVLSTVTNGVCPRVITRTWLATDACGNTNTCIQIVTVVDTSPPVLTCATNKTVQCGTAWTFDAPIASDACSTNVTISIFNTVTNGICPKVFMRTWVATDACGNTNTCSQTVTVVDTICVACETWTPHETNRVWTAVASSADGSRLVATVSYGLIYTSGNAGLTWTPQNSGNLGWVCVASDSTGQHLVAAANPGQIYTSSNFGGTWTAQTSGNKTWRSVASDSTGQYLVAVADNDNIYTSNNSGGAWTARGIGIGLQHWHSVASSADGSKLVAVGYGIPIYTSGNAGLTWTAQTTSGIRDWQSVASSADGSKLVAGVYQGLIYTSGNAGLTWTHNLASSGLHSWDSIASSADGNKLVAVVYNGLIYCSTDSGVSWAGHESNRQWSGVAASSDASKLVAVVYGGGQIYTAACPPAFVLNCATNKTVNCGTAWTFDAPTVSDSCNGANVTLTVLNTVTNGICPRVITRTWLATDACGNTNTCSQIVSVVDTTPPVLTCATNKTVQCGTAWTFDAPTASDACSTNVTISIFNTVTNGICPKVFMRTWVATDACGNTNTCSQTVTVVDTTPPVLTCSNPTVMSFSAGTTNDDFAGLEQAFPSAGLLLRLQIAGITSLKGFDDNCAINTFFAHTFTNLPSCISGATLRVRLKGCVSNYTYDDTFGLSFTSPSGALAQPGWSRYLGSHNSNPATGLFTDFDSGTTLDVVLDLSLLPNADGSTTDLIPTINAQGLLDLVVQDDSSIDFAVLTVTSCCGTNINTKTVNCGTDWAFDAPTAMDSCSGTNVTLTVLSTVTNGVCPRIITRTWKATDACGNSVTNSQAVTVVDTTPPVLNCATNKTVQCGTAWTFDAPTASDACSTNVTISILNTVTNGTCPKVITRTWVVIDACGNTNTCTQTVTLVDTTPPVLTCATNKIVECGTAWRFDAPTVSDACSGTNVVVTIFSTVTNGVCPMVITRTWLATDECNNAATCTQTVTVVDTTPPVIICATNKTVLCGHGCSGPLTFSPLHSFAGPITDGRSPQADLIEGSDGALYGTTAGGGQYAGNHGTVFKLNKDGSGYQSLWSFGVPPINGYDVRTGLVEGSDGYLYGTTHEGAGYGVVFKLRKDGTGYTVLHGFLSSAQTPSGALARGSGGTLYGVTAYGGSHHMGTVFKLKEDGTGFAVLWNFGGTANDGQFPGGRLVKGSDGAFYGVTTQGGTADFGTVFKLKEDGTGYAVVWNFGGSPNDAQGPNKGLLAGSGGALYGQAYRGGSGDKGALFMVTENGTAHSLLHSFAASGSDGPFQSVNAVGNLAFGCDGAIYGVASGGTGGAGWVFKVNTDGSGYTVVRPFATSAGDGSYPGGGLMRASDGALYGTTVRGGTAGFGTVFKLTPSIATWDFDLPLAYDACSGTNVTVSVLSTVTNGVCPMVITRTWVAMDACGNTNTCDQTVTVVDTMPPVLTCATNKTVQCGTAWTFDAPTVSDSCSGTNLTVSILSTVTNGVCPRIITRTWKATDACGNTNTCIQIVTVVDTIAPVLIGCENIITNALHGTTGNYVNYSAAAVDGCFGPVPVTFVPPPGSFFPVGTTLVIGTALDACGNTKTCEFTVTVRPSAEACLNITREVITCLTNGGYSYTFSVTNLSTGPIAGFLFAGLPTGVTITPYEVVLPAALAPGQGTTVAVTISSTGCAPTNLCFRLSTYDEHFEACCFFQHCIALQGCCTPHTYTFDADFASGYAVNLNYTNVHDQLQINSKITTFPYVWIASGYSPIDNMDRGSVMKIDAITGVVLGEYRTAPTNSGLNPSRTTVDRFGNCWVANRAEGSGGQGSVAKVALIIGGTRVNAAGIASATGQYLKPPFAYNSGAMDRDNDGLIKTSMGLNNVLPWAAGTSVTTVFPSAADDEAITMFLRVPGSGARSLAVDRDNNLWVGGYASVTEKDHQKFDSTTGLPLSGIFNNGSGGYGAVIDRNGILWSAGGSSGLFRMDTLPLAPVAGNMGTAGGEYGLSIDPCTDNLWHTVAYDFSYNAQANGALGSVFVRGGPSGAVIAGPFGHGNPGAQGVCVDQRGNVFVAHGIWGGGATTVGRLTTSGCYVGNIPLTFGGSVVGRGPTGVAVGHDGKIWVSCYQTHNVLRIDPNSPANGFSTGCAGSSWPNWTTIGAVDLVVDLNANGGTNAWPYNYSDNTGFHALGSASPGGFWNVIRDGCVNGLDWGTVSWNSLEPAGTSIKVEVRASDTQLGLAGKPFTAVSNDVSFCGTGIAGRYLEIRTSFYNVGGCNAPSPVLYDLTVDCSCVPKNHMPRVDKCPDPFFTPVNNASVTHMLSISVADVDGDPLTVTWSEGGVVLQTNIVPAGVPGATTAALNFTHNYGPGHHVITILVNDGTSGVFSCTVVVQIGDSKCALITAPTGVSVAAFSGVIPNFLPGLMAVDDHTPTAQLVLNQRPLPGTVVDQGVHLVQLTARDLAGNTATSQTFYAVSPVVRITAPANYATFTAPATISVATALAADVTGVARVRLLNGGAVVGTNNKAPYGFAISNLAAGTYLLTAQAVSTADLLSTSEGVIIDVLNPDAATPGPIITSVALTSRSLTFSLLTEPGVTFHVEYSETLAQPIWMLLRTIGGNGSVVPVTDETTNAARRFYRVRRQ